MGSSVDAVFNGDTALILAAENGHLEIVKYLCETCEAKIDISCPSRASKKIDRSCPSRAYGSTALSWAASAGHASVVDYLASRGADVDSYGKGGTTPLMLAASGNMSKAIATLLDHKAKIDVKDANGISAVMFASYYGHLDAVKCLRERGADLYISCKEGLTALLYAKKNGHQAVVEYLRQPLPPPPQQQNNNCDNSAGECHHPFVEEWNADYFVCVDCKQPLTDTTRIENEKEMKKKTGDNSTPEDAIFRGIKCRWLLQFTTENNLFNVPTYKVRRDFILPKTEAEGRCRYVELIEMKDSGAVGKAETFVSHSWGSFFGDLVAATCDGADLDRYVWVDIFAVRQFPTMNPDLDFRSVVKQCTSFIVVCSSLKAVESLSARQILTHDLDLIPPDAQKQIAFLRVWCLVEMHAAATNPYMTMIVKCGNYAVQSSTTTTTTTATSKLTFKENYEMLRKMGIFIDINRASATNPVDKDRELAYIEKNYAGGLLGLQRVLKGIMSGSLHTCKYSSVQWALLGDKQALNTVLGDAPKFFLPACGCGNIQLAKQVTTEYIKQGGDVNKCHKDDGDFTALCAAAQGGFLEIVRYLHEEYKADLETSDTIIFTAQSGQLAVVEYLASKSVHVASQSSPPRTWSMALMAAARLGFDEIVTIFLDNGVDVDYRDSNGVTAVCCAAFFGHLSTVQLLRRRGANIYFRTRDGRLAVNIAEDNGFQVVVDYLEKADDSLPEGADAKHKEKAQSESSFDMYRYRMRGIV